MQSVGSAAVSFVGVTFADIGDMGLGIWRNLRRRPRRGPGVSLQTAWREVGGSAVKVILIWHILHSNGSGCGWRVGRNPVHHGLRLLHPHSGLVWHGVRFGNRRWRVGWTADHRLRPRRWGRVGGRDCGFGHWSGPHGCVCLCKTGSVGGAVCQSGCAWKVVAKGRGGEGKKQK